MEMKRLLRFAVCVAFGAALGSADGITYTCAPSIDATQAGTCAYLNSTIAGLYNSTFSNANASIYIQQNGTGLGSSTTGFLNLISYSTYVNDLDATASADAVDVAALASLPASEPALYEGASIEVTSALGQAIGISLSDLTGMTAGGDPCTLGTAGCYNGIVTIVTPANLNSEESGQSLYWRQTGGAQGADAYDFYSVVEHETDEILGTGSCISTTGASLADSCFGNNASAVDLFRYNAGSRVFIDTTSGAYFSYNGGATNGADGALFNTLANGHDYADFTTTCQHVQDATGCLGGSSDITTDGGSEINILDAIGYNLNQQGTETPEPSAMSLFGAGLAALAVYRRRRA